ncbi:RE1 [Symbiodinium sp. CCMP2592]|nr:RE1 [Symbiodinium sp. CCMP2592]
MSFLAVTGSGACSAMAGGDAADPWSAPGSDPWQGNREWSAGETTGTEAAVNEPNETKKNDDEDARDQSTGGQDGGEPAASAADSWRRDEWKERPRDHWQHAKDGSSDGGGSADATTSGSDRRASDGMGRLESGPLAVLRLGRMDAMGRWKPAIRRLARRDYKRDYHEPRGTTAERTYELEYHGPRDSPAEHCDDAYELEYDGPLDDPAEHCGSDFYYTIRRYVYTRWRLLIPSFSGDAEGSGDLGTSARSYLRQVAAWEKMTKLSPSQRALVLYQNLQGSAWVNSESLCVEDLAQDNGVQTLKDWITQHYLDVEVTQVGRSLSDLFRKLKRRPAQSFRDYTSEFNRLLARVTECGCTLPDMATAWLYVDRASLDESTEVSLLASVGNRYALRELQQAAIILDRSIRKPWEKTSRPEGGGNKRFNSVNHTEGVEGAEDEGTDGEFDLIDRVGEDTGDLYARYRDATKARGIDNGNASSKRDYDPGSVRKAAEAKVQLAKSKSFCAACGQRGHWHRDPICPQRGNASKPQTVHVTNEIMELSTKGHSELFAILDSACSKSVVGTGWLDRYLTLTRGKGYDIGFIYEREAFKFGAASKIYESSYAAVILVPIYDKCVAVKCAVIHGDIPLLMSRPALAELGLVLDLGTSSASFKRLGSEFLKLQETSSGHPAIRIDHSSLSRPDVSCLPKNWEGHGVAVVSPCEVYMVACGGDWGCAERAGERVAILLYGSAEAFSTELERPVSSSPTRDMSSSGRPAIWKMTKAQLLEECLHRGMAVSEKWTCPELRAVLVADRDHNEVTEKPPKGLSAMSLAELRVEADRMGMDVGPRETRGSLMLRIRDAACPDETVMAIGRFKGSSFMDIPENYGAWASEEERANGHEPRLEEVCPVETTPPRSEGHSTELLDETQGPGGRRLDSTSTSERDGGSEGGYMKDAPYPPKVSTRTGLVAKAKAVRRDRSPDGSERTYMDQDIAKETQEENEMLEARLAALKDNGAADRGSALTPEEGAHDMHHDAFLSCSSGSDDSCQEALISSKALGRLGDELVGVRPSAGHPGEERAATALEAGDYDFKTAGEILDLYDFRSCPKRRPGIHADAEGERVALGYYAYGNFRGVCKKSVRWPQLTKYLNAFLADHAGTSDENGRPAFWSSLTLLKDCPAAIHTDKNNLKGSPNYVISFGPGAGGGLWIEQPGGHTWRRSRNGEEVEGIVADTDRQVWEFDPRLRHGSEPSEAGRWFLASYTARTFPEATRLEKKLLRGLGFPLGSKGDMKALKDNVFHGPMENDNDKAKRSAPRRSTRRSVWKNAAFLSVMFTTVLSAMGDAVRDLLPERPTSTTALLEVGGVSATCWLAEFSGDYINLAEPIVMEDVICNDHPADLGIGYLEAAVMRHRPGQLWLHVLPDWGDSRLHGDLTEAIALQLGEGRAVVFERQIEEDTLWEDLTGGWGEADYAVHRDVSEDGNELVRVRYEEYESYVNEVFIGDSEDHNTRVRVGHRAVPPGHGPVGAEIFAGENVGPGSEARGEHRAVPPGPGAAEAEPQERGAKAIRFPPSVPGRIASSLRRLHQNLGHPSAADFVRHLRLAGAGRDVLKAARGLECQVCQRCKLPGVPKPAKIAPCLRFNQMVGVDLFYVHDSEDHRHQLLSMVDFSSGYHVVVPVARKDSSHLERAFCENWLNIFGAPDVIAVDMENGLEKSFAKVSDWTGSHIRSAAGQAHFQAGYTERQGAIWKSLFSRVCEEMSVCKSEIHLAIGAVSSAKNNLMKSSGFSPVQHVFGSSPTLPEDLLNGPHANSPNEDLIIDDSHARQVAIRTAARAAYYHVQTDERVRRALASRTRVTARRPEVGERIFYFRKTKNAKRGMWVGPGTVIGEEGVNIWVTRGGRCVLCAPEHVRLATAEELGEAFSLRAAHEEEIFADEEDIDMDDGRGAGPVEEGGEPPDDEEMPLDLEGEGGDPPQQGRRRELERRPPVVLKRQRRKGRPTEPGDADGAHQVNMLKRAKTERSREKQLEKEIPWSMIPEHMRDVFQAAEAKQWAEHVDSGALEVLDLAESERIRAEVPAERILGSRYAYRDKNMGLRRINPETAWKAKARLVVAGHQDPDVGVKEIVVDSPTVARSSLLAVLQICASKRWTTAAGDIQAAFLQGVELQRELWLSLPRGGVKGLHPRQLARIRKEVFGLSESPRMWYDRLSSVLLGEVFEINGDKYRLCPSPLDPCVLMLLKNGEEGEPAAYLTIHVDDILVGAPPEVNRYLRERISALFPVDDWILDNFEYTGSLIRNDDDGIYINQANFVEGRLFKVDVPRQQAGLEPATLEQEIDNRSLIGALSWLGSQSRPDLQCGVALSQQLQRAPLTQDVRFVNGLTVKAEEHKDEGIYLRRINLQEAIFVAFHDAAWANAELEEAEEGFRLTAQEIRDRTFDELYTDQRPRKAKRSGSKLASQIGHLVMLFDDKLLDGERSRGSILEWRSQSCKRVCRSTFGAETMAAIEGMEGAQYVRALLASLLAGRLVRHEEARKRWPLLCATDCKSLYDHLHKTGMAKIPTDRRLAIDLVAMRQELAAECWNRRFPIQWIPTSLQLADPLTKPMRVNQWWEYVKNGFCLPLKKGIFSRREKEGFNQCECEVISAATEPHVS